MHLPKSSTPPPASTTSARRPNSAGRATSSSTRSRLALNLLNDKERGDDDQPSIGIILCAEKDDVEVEYALRTKMNPIGVAAYQLQSKLPAELKGKLPTAKQLAAVVRTVLPERRTS